MPQSHLPLPLQILASGVRQRRRDDSVDSLHTPPTWLGANEEKVEVCFHLSLFELQNMTSEKRIPFFCGRNSLISQHIKLKTKNINQTTQIDLSESRVLSFYISALLFEWDLFCLDAARHSSLPAISLSWQDVHSLEAVGIYQTFRRINR